MSLNPRLVVGKRANGDIGVFASPSGVNAFTAADSSLVMNISSKISQLILLGSTPSTTTVPLGLGSRPIVFVTSLYSAGVIIGASAGPFRPSPFQNVANASVTINSSGASMTVNTPSGVTTVYAVYSKAF